MSKPKKVSQGICEEVVLSKMLAPPLLECEQAILPAEVRLWNVGLSQHPDMLIEAASQSEAIAGYNLLFGIISTEHAYRIG